MDAEKTEIVSGANARDQQALFRLGWRRLFDDRFNAIEVATRRDAPSADGSVVLQQALARRLHSAY